MIFRWTISLFLLLSLLACAKPPVQKLDATQFMVARARAVQAPEFTPAEFQAAEQALQDAQRMIDEHDYSDAELSLELALQHARRAIKQTEEIKKKAEEEARQVARKAQKATAEKAKATKPEQDAAPIKPKQRPKPAAKPKTPLPAKTYEVREGETLWTISNQTVVYGDGLLWPLLYQANRDQIKDPRQIYPGQVLNIRRDLTDEEKEEAREKARESDIFPVPES